MYTPWDEESTRAFVDTNSITGSSANPALHHTLYELRVCSVVINGRTGPWLGPQHTPQGLSGSQLAHITLLHRGVCWASHLCKNVLYLGG